MKIFLFVALFVSQVFAAEGYNKKIPAELLNYNLPVVLKMSRDLLTRDSVRELLQEELKDVLKLKPVIIGSPINMPTMTIQREITESQFMEILLRNRDIWRMLNLYLKDIPNNDKKDAATEAKRVEWRKKFKEIFADKDLKKQVRTMLADPLRPLALYGKDATPGYSNMKYFANHEVVLEDKVLPPSDLKQVLIDFVSQAKKEIAVNVFDFDLQDVAQVLIDKGRAGVQVRIGIDGPNVIEKRPEVKAVYDMLRGQKNIFVHAVQPVGLNHQKLVAIDWSTPSGAKVLMSSGNFTQSCIGPEGDAIEYGVTSEKSVPNANHMITVDSYVLANLINHEISKTIDVGLQLRGREYNTSGIYQIFGTEGNDPKKNSNMKITFTPGGGLGDVNRDIIAHAIRQSSGPIRMVQFVASSKVVEDALFNKMLDSKRKRRKFDFASVADTPFALREFSTFLKMSGYSKNLNAKGASDRYAPMKPNRWAQNMSKATYQRMKNNILGAPSVYGMHMIDVGGGKRQEVNAKIHHKMLMTKIGTMPVAITGSYNFSDSAGSNQEYIVVIADKDFSKFANGIFLNLANNSAGSVEQLVLKRSQKADGQTIDDDAVDSRDSESRQVEKSTIEPTSFYKK
jgi:phosphatidylserine/phosphatidylglycerophosphate/cardiolipin synthase-like enzyme